MTADASLFEVATMTRAEREERNLRLVSNSRDILADAIEKHIWGDGLMLAATVILFSGGNDSTVLAHMFKDVAEYAGHANTGVGIEQTRDFVRNTCEEWGLPLLERMAPREVDRYRSLVMTRERGKRGQALGGFPGPAMHFKIYTRLKERAFEEIRRELVSNPRKERIVLLAGRRRSESKRRQNIPKMERRGSTVWVSPLVDWTKPDLNTYCLMEAEKGTPVPVNDTANLVHMSGECLCGCMASPNERAEIAYWYPGAFEDIAAMEAKLVGRDDIPEHRKVWGWGANPAAKAAEVAYLAEYRIEPEPEDDLFLCSSCADRFEAAS